MLVYEFAGAGSEALAWLHAVGGSSRTVLEAVDRYAAASLAGVLGREPERAVSPEVAAALAAHARRRAAELAPADVPIIGVGCSATIATDRTKRGSHGVCLAVEGSLGRHELALELNKGERDRDAEERLVSTLVVHAAASGCGVLHRREVDLLAGEEQREGFVPAPPLAIRGTETVSDILERRSLSNPDLVPSRSILVRRISPAPRSATSRHH